MHLQMFWHAPPNVLTCTSKRFDMHLQTFWHTPLNVLFCGGISRILLGANLGSFDACNEFLAGEEANNTVMPLGRVNWREKGPEESAWGAVQKNRFANLILILKTTEIHWKYWGYQLFFLCFFYKKMMPSGLWRRMKSNFHLILEIVVAILLLECIV